MRASESERQGGMRDVDVSLWLMPDSVFRLQRAQRWVASGIDKGLDVSVVVGDLTQLSVAEEIGA